MYGSALNDKSATRTRGSLAVGTVVCVWNPSLDKWCGGFEVAEVNSAGYRLRRPSDGHVFDEIFDFGDVTVERRRNPMRGISDSHLDRRSSL